LVIIFTPSIELAALKILQPLYESRRKNFAAQKNFWGIALGQHSEIGQHLLDPKDAEAMTYLYDLWVERDPNEHRAFTLEFVSNTSNCSKRKPLIL
jgi:template-activating factor I